MSRCKLEEFITYEQPAKYIVDSDQYDDSFDIPVLTAGKSFILGYTDETNNIFDNLPVIIFDDFTTSVQFVDFPFKVKSSAMKLLKNTEQADIKYCYYLLKFLQHTPENHKRQWLSATSQNIVELPTIEEQKNIVRKLDKILEVIDNQNKQLELLDEAIKARFVEMFGDPVDNPMNWKKRRLKDIVTEDCTISYGIVQTGEEQKEGIPVFRPVDIVNHTPKVEELKKTTEFISDRYKKTLLKGHELLITVRANIADTFIADEEFMGCNVGRGIVPIRTQEDIMRLEFLKCLIDNKHLNDILKSKAKGITLIQLNMEDLRNVELIIPPIDLQIDYLKYSRLIDKSRSRIQKSLEASQELFDSLMQEYFG